MCREKRFQFARSMEFEEKYYTGNSIVSTYMIRKRLQCRR